MLRAFGNSAVRLNQRVDECNGTVIVLNLLIEQAKDSRGAGQCEHNHRKLVRNLSDRVNKAA